MLDRCTVPLVLLLLRCEMLRAALRMRDNLTMPVLAVHDWHDPD